MKKSTLIASLMMLSVALFAQQLEIGEITPYDPETCDCQGTCEVVVDASGYCDGSVFVTLIDGFGNSLGNATGFNITNVATGESSTITGATLPPLLEGGEYIIAVEGCGEPVTIVIPCCESCTGIEELTIRYFGTGLFNISYDGTSSTGVGGVTVTNSLGETVVTNNFGSATIASDGCLIVTLPDACGEECGTYCVEVIIPEGKRVEAKAETLKDGEGDPDKQ